VSREGRGHGRRETTLFNEVIRRRIFRGALHQNVADREILLIAAVAMYVTDYPNKRYISDVYIYIYIYTTRNVLADFNYEFCLWTYLVVVVVLALLGALVGIVCIFEEIWCDVWNGSCSPSFSCEYHCANDIKVTARKHEPSDSYDVYLYVTVILTLLSL